jgi:hypothetical protein
VGIFKSTFGVLLSVVLFLGSPFGIGTHPQPVNLPQNAYQATFNSDTNYNVAHNPTKSETMEKSNYHSVRKVLSASQFIDGTLGKFSPVASTPVGSSIQIAAKVVKGGIYVEDWRHTDKEIKRRVNEILSSAKLINATEYPGLYSQFEKYTKTSLKQWVPDRDYPKIGYLPKELLYDQSLGEKEITKYWPEATKKEQAKYVALTFDELVLNYELVWHDFSQSSNKISTT